MALFDKKKKEYKKVTEKVAEKTAAPASMKDLYGEKGAVSETAKAKIQKSVDSRAYQILLKPLVTEKASVLGTENKYAFAVAIEANKIEIAKAVKEIYGIKPLAVNVIRMDGKLTRTGRTRGARKDWKKAIVTLPEGKTIQLYEGV